MIRIFIQSPCGGTGCTTLCANLGISMARSGQSVLMRGGSDASLDMHFEGFQAPGVSTGERGPGGISSRTIEANLQLVDIVSPQDSMRGGRTRDSAEYEAGSWGKQYDVEIVDCGAVIPLGNTSSQDWVLYVASTDARCYRGLSRVIAKHYGDPSTRILAQPLLVANQHLPESRLATDTLSLMSESLGSALFPSAILWDESLREALAKGLPLSEYAPYSPAQQVMDSLAEHLLVSSAEMTAAAI